MKEQLIFLLVPETKWTYYYTILPVRVTDSGDFYSYLGLFTNDQPATAKEKQILTACRKLKTASLYKTYGGKKYKTERDFTLNTDEELLKRIRIFTGQVVAKILKQLHEAGLPLYLKKSHFDNPHKSDRIRFVNAPLKVVTGFYRTEEYIRYQLTLSRNGKEIVPSRSELSIVTLEPGMILIENELYSLPEGFNGIRIKPFLDKEDILIPRQNEKEYFRKFILKNIGNENIEAEGFEILEREGEKTPVLLLEKDISGAPLIGLRFRYNNRTIRFSSLKTAIVELEEDDEQYRFYKTDRDRRWEEKMYHWLLREGLSEEQPDYFKLVPQNTWPAVIEWIRTHHKVLQKKGVAIVQDKLPEQYYTGDWQLDYQEQATNDWFRLKANIILDDGQVIPFQDLWKNILSGEREYRFGENSVFIIPEEWFSRYSAIMLFGKKNKDQLLLQRNQFSILEEETGTRMPEDSTEAPVPEKLKATLREYQLTGYQWLYNLYHSRMGACLADDMGLGKTIQTIALLLKYKEETKRFNKYENSPPPPAQPDMFALAEEEEEEQKEERFATCLIVAPASVVHNWRNELRKFAPSLTVAEYTGPTRTAMRPALMRWEVVITTYQTLRNDIDFLKNCRFGMVVFDESQSFKNRDSQIYKAVCLIEGNHFIALSGTPIENSLSDLWSLMSVINPGLLGDHSTFYNYFIRPITTNINGLHSESLRKLIQPFILRRTKEEVLNDLPERTDELIICEADPEQESIYEEELSKARNHILEKQLIQEYDRRETFGSLQAIIRLRQIANHPRLADPDYPFSSGKFREIFRMLEELISTRHKVLLFSDYVSYLNLVAAEMDKRSWEYAMLTGSTTNREEVIRHFSTDPECQFFLISLKAGGVGLNLTEADYVFILDPWWNLAAEEQAISRAHRIGQKHAVFVYRFITAGTLEEKILNIQRQKQDISDAIILQEESRFQLTEKEMERLLTE
ncbi:MAG: DEAD/DEAH box helicase [Tannerellaceae bacterium]|nr:DEAD/DEAH box helicase [Tannerellaceae bacterium]